MPKIGSYQPLGGQFHLGDAGMWTRQSRRNRKSDIQIQVYKDIIRAQSLIIKNQKEVNKELKLKILVRDVKVP
jgi:hypothetical protein